MSALQVVDEAEDVIDPVVDRLDEMLAALAGIVADDGAVPDADRVDRIAALERLRAAVAAAQTAEIVRFAQSQVQTQLDADVHPRVIGRGIADQIALACRISPWAGSRRLSTARAWWFDLRETYAALTRGELSEQVGELVVTETRHLDADTRRTVDIQLHAAGLCTMGVKGAAACARRRAYAADPAGYVARGRHERQDRHVSLRPAPDTMALLTAYLPVEQGVACYAALRRHADASVAAGDDRRRGQVMADSLVERLTGQAAAADVPFELHLLMPLQTLTGGDAPVELAGTGPLPADTAREILAGSQGPKWWRRLFTNPTGQLVGGDPHRRLFDGFLATLIQLRDQTCRDPGCNAGIREHDHIVRYADGGPTTYPNGRGVCARGNQVREVPGWRLTLVDSGLDGRPHATLTTTPTGHTYLSQAPNPP